MADSKADTDKIDALTSAVGALQARVDALERTQGASNDILDATRRDLSRVTANHDALSSRHQVLDDFHDATLMATREALVVLGEKVGLTDYRRPTPPTEDGAS